MLLELVFIRDGCFAFNNSTYFTTSDVTSFTGGISTTPCLKKIVPTYLLLFVCQI